MITHSLGSEDDFSKTPFVIDPFAILCTNNITYSQKLLVAVVKLTYLAPYFRGYSNTEQTNYVVGETDYAALL